MTRKSKPAHPAGPTGMPADKTPPAPKPGRHPADPGGTHLTGAHLPGQPGKGGFGNKVKPVPLPGKSRGR